mmetsp:Transcript_1124/g.2489  ORF Transcript_1124/g.2489 Transcript_1124/m.2489 type:complete len:82 (-) Transcript_1124:1939-2184(-)
MKKYTPPGDSSNSLHNNNTLGLLNSFMIQRLLCFIRNQKFDCLDSTPLTCAGDAHHPDQVKQSQRVSGSGPTSSSSSSSCS